MEAARSPNCLTQLTARLALQSAFNSTPLRLRIRVRVRLHLHLQLSCTPTLSLSFCLSGRGQRETPLETSAGAYQLIDDETVLGLGEPGQRRAQVPRDEARGLMDLSFLNWSKKAWGMRSSMDDDSFASAKLGKLKPLKIDLATNGSMAKCRWLSFANLHRGLMNRMASSRFQFAASISRAMAFAKCVTDRKV